MGVGTPGAMQEEEIDLRMDDLVRIWGTDPVHPSTVAYANLARNILAQAAMTPDGNRGSGNPVERQSKRKREESHTERPSWARGSTTDVTRRSWTASGPREGGSSSGEGSRGQWWDDSNRGGRRGRGRPYRGGGGWAAHRRDSW